jgi:hypothetical protein
MAHRIMAFYKYVMPLASSGANAGISPDSYRDYLPGSLGVSTPRHKCRGNLNPFINSPDASARESV